MKARPIANLMSVTIILSTVLAAMGQSSASGRAFAETDSGSIILLSAGERFNLSLGSSPSTGYAWRVLELDRSVVEVAASTYESSAPMPGAGGRSNWTFEAGKGGETTLRLGYSRSGQGPGSQLRTFSVHIVVGTGNTAWNISFLSAVCVGAFLAVELARRKRERASPPAQNTQGARAGRLFHPRTTGAMGLAGVLAMSVGLAGSIAMYPRFSLWDSNLSDLGVAAGAPFFNWGLAVCGVLGAFLALGAMFHLSAGKRMRKAGFALLAVALALLALIGVFTEAFAMFHFYVAVAFFAIFAVASLVVGFSLSKDAGLRWTGRVALFSAAMGIIAWFVPSGNGIALPELAAAVPGQLWLVLLGYRMTLLKTA